MCDVACIMTWTTEKLKRHPKLVGITCEGCFHAASNHTVSFIKNKPRQLAKIKCLICNSKNCSIDLSGL